MCYTRKLQYKGMCAELGKTTSGTIILCPLLCPLNKNYTKIDDAEPRFSCCWENKGKICGRDLSLLLLFLSFRFMEMISCYQFKSFEKRWVTEKFRNLGDLLVKCSHLYPMD